MLVGLLAGSDPMPDVLDLLAGQHEEVRKLLAALEDAEDGQARARLLDRFERHLAVHERVEEDILYPAVRDHADRDGGVAVLEAREEHHLMNEVLRDLRAVDAGSDQFAARLHVLRVVLLHHFEDEEGRLFPTAREVLDEDERRDLARRLDDERERLMGTDIESLRRPSTVSP